MKFPKPQKREKQRRPLQRKRPMRKRRARRIDRETPAEKHWKGPWLHARECVGKRAFPGHVCNSHVQQMHFRDHTGLGLKASNFQSIPGCGVLHMSYDMTSGEFATMGLTGKKSWFLFQLIVERADFVREHGCTPEEWTP